MKHGKLNCVSEHFACWYLQMNFTVSCQKKKSKPKKYVACGQGWAGQGIPWDTGPPHFLVVSPGTSGLVV